MSLRETPAAEPTYLMEPCPMCGTLHREGSTLRIPPAAPSAGPDLRSLSECRDTDGDGDCPHCRQVPALCPKRRKSDLREQIEQLRVWEFNGYINADGSKTQYVELSDVLALVADAKE